jgi:hypothetical protein
MLFDARMPGCARTRDDLPLAVRRVPKFLSGSGFLAKPLHPPDLKEKCP